jgi:hypothetical protein
VSIGLGCDCHNIQNSGRKNLRDFQILHMQAHLKEKQLPVHVRNVAVYPTDKLKILELIWFRKGFVIVSSKGKGRTRTHSMT